MIADDEAQGVQIVRVEDGRIVAGDAVRLIGRDSRRHARGVRDLVAYGDGYLVVAGPVRDPESGVVADADYTVHAWDGRDATRSLGDLKAYGTTVKPEALLPLSAAAGRLRAPVPFDGPDEGAPRTVELETP